MNSGTRLSEVGVGGRNLERLDRAVTEIGNKAYAVQGDILDEHRLASVAAGMREPHFVELTTRFRMTSRRASMGAKRTLALHDRYVC